MLQEISYEVIDNIPVFKCSSCVNCSNMESINMFNTHRGCCFYFPKYSLLDIKNTMKFDGSFPLRLIKMKNVLIHNYYIEVKGTFDEEKYNNFLENTVDEDLDKYRGFDVSLFFKRCSFVTAGGCMLDFRLRPHQCNLYLCRHVIANCGKDYPGYNRERKDYYAYCKYMNICLEEEFEKNSVTLLDNFKKCLKILSQTKIGNFSFSNLRKITY